MSDPIHISEIALQDIIWQGVDEPRLAIHPFDGKCKVCENPLEEPLWRTIDHPKASGYFPVNCCDRCYEAAKLDGGTNEAAIAYWESRCPIEFRKPWNPALGDPRALAKILAFDPARGRGLVIHGATDTGKTRMTWQLLRNFSARGIEWLFVEAIDLLDNIPDGAYSVPVLVIDDLGNDQLTQAKEVKLLKVLRKRVDWHRPVIVTTQFLGEKLAERFSDSATAQAVIRRLRGFCDSVNPRESAK